MKHTTQTLINRLMLHYFDLIWQLTVFKCILKMLFYCRTLWIPYAYTAFMLSVQCSPFKWNAYQFGSAHTHACVWMFNTLLRYFNFNSNVKHLLRYSIKWHYSNDEPHSHMICTHTTVVNWILAASVFRSFFCCIDSVNIILFCVYTIF